MNNFIKVRDKKKLPKKIQKAFDEYLFEMYSFRNLFISSKKFISDSRKRKNNNSSFLEISIASLLLRQCIELLIFSSLIIDKKKYELIEKCKNWRIGKVIEGIEKINKKWLPISVELSNTLWINNNYSPDNKKINKNSKQSFKLKENVLNKNKICEYYDYLSKLIHYENPLKEDKTKKKKDIEEIIFYLENIWEELKNFMHTFFVKISSTDYFFYININIKNIIIDVYKWKKDNKN